MWRLQMISNYDVEIQEYVKSKILKPDDKVSISCETGEDRPAIFKNLSKVFYGRLLAPGVVPGQYWDRKKALVEVEGKELTVDISDINIDQITLAERLAQLEPGWHFINLQSDFICDLPKTAYMEGDIVSITDKLHENFDTDIGINQFTIYRIYYDTADSESIEINYKLRSGKLIFDATENQLMFRAVGPVKLFYSGEGYKLRWKPPPGYGQDNEYKNEAEFYLLLGRYTRTYNPLEKSYNWGLDAAKQMILLGKAHAILKIKEKHYLVNFWDSEVGRQIALYPNLILDI